jgi:hypothetical protein
MTRAPIANHRPAAEPSPAVLLAALRLVELGPVYAAGKRNGLVACVAAELLRRRHIEPMLFSRRAFGVDLAIKGYQITPEGAAALAAAGVTTGTPQTQRAA